MRFTFTMDLTSDPMNWANDAASCLQRAAADVGALAGSSDRGTRGTFSATSSGTIEDIQGNVLAAWEVSEGAPKCQECGADLECGCDVAGNHADDAIDELIQYEKDCARGEQ